MKEETPEVQFAGAASLDGPAFADFQIELAAANHRRLRPCLPSEQSAAEREAERQMAEAELQYLAAVRQEIAPLVSPIPSEVDEFIAWFEGLTLSGPGQGDPLFPWLATSASIGELRWFLTQEVAGEAGFEDLLAMTQVKMPKQAKLEMARNFWDEMGRGHAGGMHGPMLERLSSHLGVDPLPGTVVPESLALANAMVAMASHRCYAFHSIGAMGVIEMTAPWRAALVNEGLKRVGVPAKKRQYFAVHAVLDVRHSESWNREVLRPLVAEDPRRAKAIGEGAIIRLWHGARCFERYRKELFGATVRDAAA